MKKEWIIITIFTLVLFASCKNNSLLNDIETFKSSKIDLCLDSMIRICPVNTIDKKDYTYVIYLDSSQCFSCLNNRLYAWESIISQNPNLSVCMIYSYHRETEKLIRHIKGKRFHWPIYVDTLNIFEKHNITIKKSPLFHTFMINNSNEVVLIGNPITNQNINSLMRKINNYKLK